MHTCLTINLRRKDIENRYKQAIGMYLELTKSSPNIEDFERGLEHVNEIFNDLKCVSIILEKAKNKCSLTQNYEESNNVYTSTAESHYINSRDALRALFEIYLKGRKKQWTMC